MAESFVFYKSFGNALKKIPAESYKECMQALIDYAIDGVEPEAEDPFVSMFFELVRPQIDANERRREAGGKGGQARVKQNEANGKQTQAKAKQTQATPKQNEANGKQTQANVNVNANENVNVNDKEGNPPTPFIVPAIDQTVLEELGCSPAVAEKLTDWIANQSAKGRPITEMDLKSIVSRAKSYTAKYGVQPVTKVIEDSLQYAAIVWDRLDNKTRDKPKRAWEVTQKQDYRMDDLEARLLAN